MNSSIIVFQLLLRTARAAVVVIALCALSAPLYSQPECTVIDYNLLVDKANITLSSTAGTSGNINVLKDGNNLNNNFYYTGTNQAVAGKAYVAMVFPQAEVLTGFEIAVGAYLFSNGTVMEVQASNDGTNWTTLTSRTHNQAVSPCVFGTCPLAESYAFPDNTQAYTQYRLQGISGSSRSTPWINELYFSSVPRQQSGIAEISCNPGPQLFDTADDFITFDLNPTAGTGTYNVSVAGTTVSPTSGTFGAPTTFTLPAGSAGNGDLTLIITGFTDGCMVTQTITDPGNCLPGNCGEPDWNDPTRKATVTGDFAIPGTGGTSGPIGVLVDSDQGTSIQSKSNSATDRAVFTFQFPEATVLTGIEINVTAADIMTTATLRVEASNDGTNYTPVSIDYVLGSNLSAGAPQYGGTAAVAYTLPFAANETEYTYYRVFAPTMSTNFNRYFTEIYFDYDFFDPQLTNLNCNDNGTFENYTDDQVAFDLNPGPGTGTYSVAISGGFSISPTTGTYGAPTSFTVSSGSSGAGDLTLTLTDVSVPCTQTVVIPNGENACIPGECGGLDWNDPAIKSTITASVTVSNSPSPSDPNLMLDSNTGTKHNYKNNSIGGLEIVRFTFPSPATIGGFELGTTDQFLDNGSTMKVQGSTDASTWTDLTAVLNYPADLPLTAGAYGSPITSLKFPFTTGLGEYTYYRLIGVSAQGTIFGRGIFEVYFDTNVYDAQLGNVSFGDNGSPGIFGDDKVLFELNPTPGTGTYSVQVTGGYTVTPTSGTYGTATSFEVSAGSAGTGDLSLLIVDQSVPCVQEETIPNPNLAISVTATQAACASPTDNPLGAITLTSPDNAIVKAEFNPGTQFAGTGFASATDVTGLNTGFVLVSNLPNPEFPAYYTVRTYASETLFRDYVVSLNRKACSVAELSLSISPATASANEGETLVYVVTLNNNGPDPAQNVEVRVDIPTALEVLTSSAALGNYSLANQIWSIDEMPVGTTTLTITYRMQ